MAENHTNHRDHDDQHSSDIHGGIPDGIPTNEATDAVSDTENVRSVGPANAGRGPDAGAACTAEQVSPARAVHRSDASGRDGIRAVLNAYLSTDLLHSGPALWPFGRRARERRARNRAIAGEARRRREQLRADAAGALGSVSAPAENQNSVAVSPRQWRPVNRSTHRRVVLGLTAVVAAVALTALWWRSPDSRPETLSPVARQPTAAPGSGGTFSTSTTVVTAGGGEVGSLPAQPPIPSGGVTPLTPRPDTATDIHGDVDTVRIVAPPTGAPTRTDLATPEAAMRAWLARLCPFTHTDPFGTAEQRARPAMTPNGWSTLNPLDRDGSEADQRARASWDKTVAARESGRCAESIAQISAEAPRTPTSVIVIGAATRVITTSYANGTAGVSPYVEQLSEVRVVRRGADGLWRVDVPTEGG